jgi:micrococcal nuclease
MYTYKISPLKIVDGDTIDAEIDLGFDIKVKKRVRFMGINAPESRTKDLEEKARGLAAKDRVKQLLDGCKNITLKSHGIGKFGRCLGELHLDTIDGQEKLTLVSLNELLINEGHATKYDGGKR